MFSRVLLFLCSYLCLSLALKHGHSHDAVLAARNARSKSGHKSKDKGPSDNDFSRYVSRPDIRAAKWHVTLYDEEAIAPGYWFVAPYEMLRQKERGEEWVGAYIYDATGELVWSGIPLFDSFNIFDFRPIEVNGEHMFTAIYKRMESGIIVDNSYQVTKRVEWPGGYEGANMHEFTVYDGNTRALVMTHEHILLSEEESLEFGHAGTCDVNVNGLLELDISTTPPAVLSNISFIDHISLNEATYPAIQDAAHIKKQCENGWDAFHCNAVDHFPNGDYLVSCRHTDTLYKISHEHKSIVWRLGGTNSDFEFVGDGKFSRQHHARVWQSNDTHTLVTLFDNARGDGRMGKATHDNSRGLMLSLHDGLAEVLASFERPDHAYTTSRGSMEILPNGNVFMGWTFHSRISEHLPDGTLLMKAKLPPHMNTYRSYKSPWIGRPSSPPDLVAHIIEENSLNQTTTQTEVFVSWNGATEVATWNFYSSLTPDGENLELAASTAKQGFETSMKLNGKIPYLFAIALDKSDAPLPHGRSAVALPVPADRKPQNYVEEQEWLAEHLPYGPSVAPVSMVHEAEKESASVGASGGGVSWYRPTASTAPAYVAGFFTCVVGLAVGWAGWGVVGRVLRRRRERAYRRVDGDGDGDGEGEGKGFKEVVFSVEEVGEMSPVSRSGLREEARESLDERTLASRRESGESLLGQR